jgi:hypothetical protein
MRVVARPTFPSISMTRSKEEKKKISFVPFHMLSVCHECFAALCYMLQGVGHTEKSSRATSTRIASTGAFCFPFVFFFRLLLSFSFVS